jgi:hypothetical protein
MCTRVRQDGTTAGVGRVLLDGQPLALLLAEDGGSPPPELHRTGPVWLNEFGGSLLRRCQKGGEGGRRWKGRCARKRTMPTASPPSSLARSVTLGGWNPDPASAAWRYTGGGLYMYRVAAWAPSPGPCELAVLHEVRIGFFLGF